MRLSNWLSFSLLVFAAPACFAATKDNELPDREMLRMMEFLRELEMIRQMEMMKDLQHVEQLEDQASRATAQKTPPKQKRTQ